MTTTTVGSLDSGTSDWGWTARRSRIFRVPASSTAGTELVTGELPEYQSPSMVPPRNGEQTLSLLMLWIRQSEPEGAPEIRAVLSTPTLVPHPEPDPRIWRGVFSPSYHFEVLFSQQVEVRTAELPRWRPRITIDRRTLARGDDE
jgi:hypothetical protein